jgi:hypothetical protein
MNFRALQANALVDQTTRQLLTSEQPEEKERPDTFRRRHVSLLHDYYRREQQEDSNFEQENTCDKSLLLCLPNENCADCFRFLYNENIDWGTVTPDTSCSDVVDFLDRKDYCRGLKRDQAAFGLFCKVQNN